MPRSAATLQIELSSSVSIDSSLRRSAIISFRGISVWCGKMGDMATLPSRGWIRAEERAVGVLTGGCVAGHTAGRASRAWQDRCGTDTLVCALAKAAILPSESGGLADR